MGKNRTNISIVDRAGIRRKAEIVIGKKGSNSSGTIFDANAVEEMLNKKLENYTIINIDSIVVAQAPKLAPYIDDMRQNISDALEMDLGSVSVKATTTEKLGFEGRGEGISSMAVVLLK